VEVRISRASAVVVQRVPPAVREWFLEWQQGITQAAETFAGYRGTDVYAPPEGRPEPWVIVLHFDDDQSLDQWLGSPQRAAWLEKLRGKVEGGAVKVLSGGFGPWFAGLAGPSATVPPSWKMALTVLLGLYPTVMLLTLFVGPYTSPLGLAVSMLSGNALSVSLLQWAVMPVLTRLLGRWLKANQPTTRALSLGGTCAVVLLLAGLTLLFRWLAG
jgi:antibiotic biosynthesis monooxygenase (ABM) superfamily enzyme